MCRKGPPIRTIPPYLKCALGASDCGDGGEWKRRSLAPRVDDGESVMTRRAWNCKCVNGEGGDVADAEGEVEDTETAEDNLGK